MDPQDPFDPAHFAMPADWSGPVPTLSSSPARRHRRKRSTDQFFTIASWRWFAAVARLPGKALHVGVLLWHLRNLTNSTTVRWRPSKAREFGLSRHATYRGLESLEAAGLVTVKRHVGRCAVVTIVDVECVEKTQSQEDEAVQ
jgi:hypothetical protein